MLIPIKKIYKNLLFLIAVIFKPATHGNRPNPLTIKPYVQACVWTVLDVFFN